MHAIWFSLIVTTMVLPVWIWPALRVPKVWFGLFVLMLVGSFFWLGTELESLAADGGAPANLAVRTLFVLLSETGKPIAQITFGFFAMSILSLRPQNAAAPQCAQEIAKA